MTFMGGGNKVSGTFDWTAARIAELRAKWEDCESATAIERHFAGLENSPSRSAILGKVHRLRLAKRREAWKRIEPARSSAELVARAERERQRVREKYARSRQRKLAMMGPQLVPDAYPVVDPPPPEFLGVSLIDLASTQCHYPRGEGPYLYCGQPKERGSYCGHCYRIVYTPHRPARRAPFIQRGWAA
jgi:hypothetical protein